MVTPISPPLNGHAHPIAAPDPSLVAQLRELYTTAGQSHVFTFFDTLTPFEQSSLIAQLSTIDVARVNRIYISAVAADLPSPDVLSTHEDTLAPHFVGRDRTPTPQPEEVLPLPDEACASIVGNPSAEAEWREIGLEAVSENRVAVLLMAGGQGTRLGSTSPKGMYDIGLPSGSSLFDYQAARIRRLERVAEQARGKPEGSVRVRWYVMTSGPTREETEKYFQARAYFGLDPDNVVFFEQGVLPALSNEGKLLLASPSAVAVAPDGNGGLYAALRRPLHPNSSRTVMSDLRAHGISYMHVYGVDNCLVRVADPTFIGVCIARKAECGAKVVRKTIPTESVGVLAMRGESFSVIEYSELSKEKAEMTGPDGRLAFRAANIVNHFYTIDFLDSIQALEKKMIFHIARKKIPTIDLQTGQPISPSSPNGMKLEQFVFDVFPFTRSLCVLEVDRAEEFSALKNAPGSKTDSPETSRRDLLAQQRRWLEASGATFAPGVEVEVTPGASYAGEGLDFVAGKKFCSVWRVDWVWGRGEVGAVVLRCLSLDDDEGH